jgi:hypothetical protein
VLNQHGNNNSFHAFGIWASEGNFLCLFLDVAKLIWNRTKLRSRIKASIRGPLLVLSKS